MIFTILTALLALNPADSLSAVLDTSIVSSVRITEKAPVAFAQMDAPALRAGEPSLSLPQKLNVMPSVVSLSEGGTGVGYTSFSVRGISGYHTNVTLNGISLGDSESQEVFWVNIPGLSSMLSSLQLQRGLGTAACGPGAFGASLNMETLSSDKWGGFAGGSFGSFGTWTGTARAWTGNLKSGVFVDAAINVQGTEGYIKNAPARVLSAYANVGWRGKKDEVQAIMLHGQQRSAITWNGVPYDIYPVDRRYNVNEGDTDNYSQTHLQLNYRHSFALPLKWNTTLNYTHGYGWYDISGVKDYLKNNLYVLRSDLTYLCENLNVCGTVYASGFVGQHWGNDYGDTAYKSEVDASVRAEWTFYQGLSLLGELQYRGAWYELYGKMHNWNFCNPRLGLNWAVGSHKLYAFAAMGNREPARADFDANPDVRNETLYDFELGYKYSSYIFSGSVNFYDMEYKDILIETGKMDSQGYVIKDNLPHAWRRGVEVEIGANPLKWLGINANCTISDNRHEGGYLPLSPGIIAGIGLNFMPLQGLSLLWETKYVGKQNKIPDYCVSRISASETFDFKCLRLIASAYLNNVFDAQYYSYVWEGGVYPAAPRNGGISLRLEF